jgi:hypothetical protein
MAGLVGCGGASTGIVGGVMGRRGWRRRWVLPGGWVVGDGNIWYGDRTVPCDRRWRWMVVAGGNGSQWWVEGGGKILEEFFLEKFLASIFVFKTQLLKFLKFSFLFFFF